MKDFFSTDFFNTIRSIFLGLAVAVLFPIVVRVGVRIITPPPSRADYQMSKEIDQEHDQLRETIREKKDLLKSFAQSSERTARQKFNELQDEIADLQKKFDEDVNPRYEQALKELEEKWNAARSPYKKLNFYSSIIAGVAGVIGGALTPVAFIGTGFIIGGIWMIAWFYWDYWTQLSDLFKFVSLFIALLALVFIGYRITGARMRKA